MAKRHYDKDSVYGEHLEQQKYDDRELDWKEKNVIGWSRWDLACLGAGGEENLLKEISLEKNRQTLEMVEKKISSLEYYKRCGEEDPGPYIKKLREYYKKLKDTKEKCFYTIEYCNGNTEKGFDRYKFHKYTENFWYEFDILDTRRSIYRISKARRGLYDKITLDLYGLRDKIQEDIQILEG